LHCVYATKEPEREREREREERERERGEDLRMASCNGGAIIRYVYNLLSIFFYFLK